MTAIDEFNELKNQLVGLYDLARAKGVELRNVQDAIAQSVAPCLDAATPAIRKRKAAERRDLLGEAELLQAELELLRRRLEGTNEAIQRAHNQPIQINAPVGPPRTLPAIPRN